jgi:tight adherence protein B
MTLALLLIAVAGCLLPRSLLPYRRLSWLAAHRWPGRSAPVGAVRSARRARSGQRVGYPAAARWAAVRWVGVTVLAGALALLLAGLVPAVLVAVSSAVLGRCARRLRQERDSARRLQSLVTALGAVIAEHAAGASFGAALGNAAAGAGSYAEPLQAAGRLAADGAEPAAALAPQPQLARLAVAAALVSRTGAAPADVLARVRADLLAAQQTRRAVAEAVAGPRSSAMLLAGLPAVGLALGVALGADPLRVLTHTVAGSVALTAGVLLDLAGLWWTLRLTAASGAGP